MELVTEPRLRELIEQIKPFVDDTRVPGAFHPPADLEAREKWFAEVAEVRSREQGRMVQMAGGAADQTTFEGVNVTEVRIPVTGACGWSACTQCGAGAIDAVVYRPVGATSAPAYLHFHGGGFWVGGGLNLLRLTGPMHARRARELGAVVIDVDYRMAPEHKFPTPVEDCFAALEWAVANAGELGIDVDRVAVGGGSAGGALAGSVALMARDRGGPKLAAQVLYIPATDSSCNTTSMRTFAQGYVMTRRNAVDMWDMYLASPADAYDPYASPMHAQSVAGLPPTLVIVGEYEVLRDEGRAYARRLVDDGVTVTVRQLPQCHGAALPEHAAEADGLMTSFLRANL